jgi:hypothetical protein
MFTVNSARLLVLQECADRVRCIVPEITEIETIVSKTQIIALYDIGVSIPYLVEGNGSMFNGEPSGKALKKEYESRKEQRFEQSLNHLLYNHSISSVCVPESFALQQA